MPLRFPEPHSAINKFEISDDNFRNSGKWETKM